MDGFLDSLESLGWDDVCMHGYHVNNLHGVTCFTGRVSCHHSLDRQMDTFFQVTSGLLNRNSDLLFFLNFLIYIAPKFHFKCIVDF